LNTRNNNKMAGEKITLSRRKKIQVPDNPIIPFIEGDGIGPEQKIKQENGYLRRLWIQSKNIWFQSKVL